MSLKTHIWKVTKWAFATIGVLLVCLLLFYYGFLAYFDWKINHEWTSSRIERITGLKVPKCKPNSWSSLGAFYNYSTVEFKTNPTDGLFEEIDKRMAGGDTLWKRDGNNYTYEIYWGYGIPAPKGEEEEKCGSFRMTITKGEAKAMIRYGHFYNHH